MLEYDEKIKSLVSSADNLRKGISERREVVETENQELIKTEQDCKFLRKEIDLLSSRITELDISRAEHKVKLENLSENIHKNYGMDIDTLEVGSLTTEDEERLIVLRQKIQELGPVNLGTL